MTDHPSKIANVKTQGINTSREQDLGIWAETFGTSRDQVKDAVGAVGTDPAAVKAYLARLRQPIRSARTSYEVPAVCLVFRNATKMTTASLGEGASVAPWDLSNNLAQILSNRRRSPVKARAASWFALHPKEKAMADDKGNTGNPDRQRISTNQQHELRDWAKEFEVPEDMLRTAVTQVGHQASDVERHLKDKAKR
jgi:Protein of unknown function (DUF3606)